MTTLDSFRDLLAEAIRELHGWSAHPGGEVVGFGFEAAMERLLKRASAAKTLDEMHLRVEIAVRTRIDSGSLSADFLPSLSVVADALHRRSARREDSP